MSSEERCTFLLTACFRFFVKIVYTYLGQRRAFFFFCFFFLGPFSRLLYQRIYTARARQRFIVHKLVCSVTVSQQDDDYYVDMDFAKRNYLP